MLKNILSRVHRVLSIIKKKYISFVTDTVIPRRRKKYRRRLKNKDFTILCSNCIGGEIYNLLGEQFLSPTINMWQDQSDFIKFALNPQYYLEQPLVFIETDEATPVAK